MIHQTYPSVSHPYRFELNKDMHLAAAHFIPSSKAGQCQQVHGHTYYINITIGGDELNELGFLIDFKVIKDLIHNRYDHTLLNDHPEFKSVFPTTERVAEHIWKTIQSQLKKEKNKPHC